MYRLPLSPLRVNLEGQICWTEGHLVNSIYGCVYEGVPEMTGSWDSKSEEKTHPKCK